MALAARQLLGSDLLRTLKALSIRLGSRQSALNALRDFLDDPESLPEIQTLLDEVVGVPLDEIRELYARYEPFLDLLLGDLGDLEDHPPVELAGERDLSFDGGTLRLSGKATLVLDADGEALDGVIEFDPEREVVVGVGVEGALSGAVGGAAGGAEIGLTGRGGAELHNYYRHPRSDTALDALLEDFTDFTAPQLVSSADRLRSRPDGSGVALRIPDQWVHLRAEYNLDIRGTFSWSQSLLSGATVSTGLAEVDEVVSVDAGVSVAAQFGHAMAGHFDIVVAPSRDALDRVRVELRKSGATETRAGIEIGAGVEIHGLEVAAKAVLDGFVPKINQLVDEVESKLGSEASLRGLFEARLDREIGGLLAESHVVDTIDAFLGVVVEDADLKERLREILQEAGVRLAGGHLDALDEHLEEVRAAVGRLVKKYRDTLAKINGLIEKAAKAKIEVAWAKSRLRAAGTEVYLAFEIDPATDRQIYRQMLRGRFERALQLAEDPGSTVEVVDGFFVERGRLEIKEALSISAVGFRFDHASILKQEWESRITLNGDVTLGVQTSLEGQLLFGRSRTLKFLADSRVLAKVGEADALEDVEADHKVSLELTDQVRRRKRKVQRLEQILMEVGVLAERGSLEAVVNGVAGEPLSGRLLTSSYLELGSGELDALTGIDVLVARRIFADALTETLASGPLATRDRGDGEVPVVLWPSVRTFFAEVAAGSSSLDSATFTPVDSQGRKVRGWSPRLTHHLYALAQYVDAFEATLSELRSLRGALRGLNRKQALAALRRRQRRLMKAAKLLVAGRLLGSKINYVFFEAALTIARRQGQPQAFAIAQVGEGEDARRFVLA